MGLEFRRVSSYSSLLMYFMVLSFPIQKVLDMSQSRSHSLKTVAYRCRSFPRMHAGDGKWVSNVYFASS